MRVGVDDLHVLNIFSRGVDEQIVIFRYATEGVSASADDGTSRRSTGIQARCRRRQRDTAAMDQTMRP